MADGQFLQDLSEGIFERLESLRKEQETADEQKKGQLVQLLAGLADKVEPESLPILMGHLGDVIGISKNKKFKGFWDAFSGLPSQDMSQQLGAKFKEITSGLVGPQQARTTREAYKQNLLQPYRQAGTRPRTVASLDYTRPPELASKMIFRDPGAEELEEVKARYGAQFQNQLLLQDERHQDALRRLQESAFLREQGKTLDYERKLNLGIDKMAKIFLGSEEVQQFPVEQRWAAAQSYAGRYLSGEADAEIQDILSRIDLRRALIDKARTEGGGSSSQELSRQRFAASQAKERRELETEVSNAEAIVNALTPQIQEMERSLDATAKSMNKTRDEILSSSLFSPTSPVIGPAGKLIKSYREALNKKAAAEATLNTKKSQLEEFTNKRSKAQPPPKAQRRRPEVSIMIRSANDPDFVRQAQSLGAGKIVRNTQDGKVYRIHSVGKDHVILVPTSAPK